MPPPKVNSNKPDADCSREELIAKLEKSRVLYKHLRDEKNEAAAALIKAEQQATYYAEQLALCRKEKAEIAEVLDNAGRDSRLIGMVGRLRATVAEQAEVLTAIGQVLNADQSSDTLPDHPLLNTAEEVVAIAGTKVSWKRIADRRLEFLDELIVRYDAADGRPADNEWVRLLGRIRTELLERVDLPDDERDPRP